jgi:hypothetical protein
MPPTRAMFKIMFSDSVSQGKAIGHPDLSQFAKATEAVVRLPNVRFGSKADISECPRNVRYSPESGHPPDANSFVQ